ncbi:MAG: hypothetical protein KF773_04115 [Deltaproteobacteria bacterium]|nr:hypothetical protein [Deltaproteobacteria bacterium]
MRAWWLVAVLAGCVKSAAVPCDDGRLCPADTRCVAGGCAAVGSCGDGEINPGEQCDDGDRVDGDGCSATCTLELCRNGVVDAGEECDDGNAQSHDGCSSACRLERPTWTEYTGPGPGLRRGHAMAWDADRGVGVLHGGTGNVVDGETWLWDGAWTRVADGPPRTFHAIAPDGLGKLAIFGGSDGVAAHSDTTHAWDGTAWTPVALTPTPGKRFDHALGRDVVPGRLLVYGGQLQNFGVSPDLWRSDGAGWTLVAGQSAGPKTSRVRLTYDPIREVVVAAGGPPGADDTYLWDGMWRLNDDGLPLEDQAQDYDPARRKLVAFSGLDPNRSNAVFEWNGTRWERLLVEGPPPPPRFRAAGFYDPIRHAFVAFGGDRGGTFGADTWVLRWESDTPDDACDGTDADGDGLTGCEDPDCWARCTPRCPPGARCDAGTPRCGDGVCNSALETSALCPADC